MCFITGKDDWGTAGKSPATIKRALSSAEDTVSLDGSDESKSATGSIAGAPLGGGGSKVGPQQQQRRSRAGRVRTVLTEKQLTMMKGCYNANCRPDALMKEQLIEMTGLSGRVIRVWFQNKRCKDKKRSIRDTMQNKVRPLHYLINRKHHILTTFFRLRCCKTVIIYL
jgi:hypothetical protein